MKETKYFEKKLKQERIIKSSLYSLILAFIAVCVTSFILYFTGKDYYQFLFVAFIISFTVSFVAVYKTKFKITRTELANRLDNLGLEQRVVTMFELENDTSYIADKQREDSLAAINKLDKKLFKIEIPHALVTTLLITIVLCSILIVFPILLSRDVINIKEPKQIQKYIVTYAVEGNGQVLGETVQEVNEEAFPVLIDVNDDWVFVLWEYNNKKNPFKQSFIEGPYRKDYSLLHDGEVTAILEELIINKPVDDNTSKSSSRGNPKHTDDDKAPPSEQEQEENTRANKKSGGDGATGENEKSYNQVIDNMTYYGGTTFTNAYADMVEQLAQDYEIDTRYKEAIQNYFDSISE